MHLQVDLHGKSLEDAKEIVLLNIRQAYLNGHLELRIITGRGNHKAADGSRGKIYQACEGWLQDPELKSMLRQVNKWDGHYDVHLHSRDLIYEEIEKQMIEKVFASDPHDLQIQAQAGDRNAQVSLGIAYDRGLLNYPIDQKLSTSWFSKAAAQGSATAQLEMGVRYFLGKGVRQNDQQAIVFFQQAAEQDALSSPSTAVAEGNLGLIYCYGYGVPVDLKQGTYWLERAANHGHPESMRRLASYYNRGCDALEKNLQIAFDWYKKAAEKGDAYSQYNLAIFYQEGLGIPIDLDAAFFWFLASARNGDADGMCGLARCYLYGRGTAIDLEAALPWIQRAEERGHCDAYVDFAAYYEEKGDHEKSLENLKIGAEHNSLFALSSLLKLGDQDPDILLNQIAEHDTVDLLEKLPPLIQFMLPPTLLSKEGSKKSKKINREKAIAILEYLAENAYPNAYMELNYLYASDTLGAPNPKKGFYYAEKGRKAGDLDCLYCVAEAYESGLGVKKDKVQASHYRQELLAKYHARTYLNRALSKINLNRDFKNSIETQSIITDLRIALRSAEQEQQDIKKRHLFKLDFFSPKVIEKKVKKLLGEALFRFSTFQLLEISSNPNDFELNIEATLAGIIESDQLGCEIANKFLSDIINPETPFYSMLVNLSVYETITTHLKKRSNHTHHDGLDLLSSHVSSSSSSLSSVEQAVSPVSVNPTQQFIRITQDASGRILHGVTPHQFKGLYTDTIENSLVLLVQGKRGVSMIHFSSKTSTDDIVNEFSQVGDLQMWRVAYNPSYHEYVNALSIKNEYGRIYKKLNAHEKTKFSSAPIKATLGCLSVDREFNIGVALKEVDIFEPKHIFGCEAGSKVNMRNIICKINAYFLSKHEKIKLDVQFNGTDFSLLFLNKTEEQLNLLIREKEFMANPILTQEFILMREGVLRFYNSQISNQKLQTLIQAAEITKIPYMEKPPARGGMLRYLSSDEFKKKFNCTYSESLYLKDTAQPPISQEELQADRMLMATYERMRIPLEGLVIAYMNDEVGYGLFTQKWIKKNTIVCAYAGVCNTSSGDDIDNCFDTDAKEIGGIGRFMQHLPMSREAYLASMQRLTENPYYLSLICNEPLSNITLMQKDPSFKARIAQNTLIAQQFKLDAFDFDLIHFRNPAIKSQVAQSNLIQEKIMVRNIQISVFTAARDISTNEIIGFSYGLSYWKQPHIGCKPVLFTKEGSMIPKEDYTYPECRQPVSDAQLLSRFSLLSSSSSSSAVVEGNESGKLQTLS